LGTGAGIAGTNGTHGPAPNTTPAAVVNRLTVFVTVAFTNTKVVENEVTTNWFLLMKNRFSLKWSNVGVSSELTASSLDDERRLSKLRSCDDEIIVGIIL
jgi:uncharacterized membrane protein